MNPEKKPKSKFVIFSLIFLSIFALFFCMPTLISTDLGRKATFYLLSHKFSGKIQAEQLSLSWFGKQKIRGIQWANQREGLFFRCEEVSTSAPLWKLLLNHHLDELKMSCPHLELDAHFSPSLHTTKPNTPYLQCGFFPMSVSSNFGHQDDGKFLSSFSDDCRRQYRYADMAEAVVRKDAKKILQVGDQNLKTHSNFSINKSYFGNIFIDRGTLLVFSKNKLLASFQQVVSQIHLPEERFPIQLALIGQTEQDNVIGKFDIKAEINSLNFDQPNLEMQAKLVHFPIFGLDELLSYFDPSLKGLLAEGIGPSFDLDLDAKFQPQVQELHLLAQSSLVHAEVEAESFNGNLVLKNPAKLSFSLPSSLFKKFAFSLKNSPEIEIALEKLSLPYGFNRMGASFQSTVRISPTELIANESKESIHLDGCMFSLSSNSLEKGVSFLSNSSLKMGNLNSQILLKADLKNPFSKSLQGNCQLQIQEFPLKIAELILSEKLVPIFGNSFDGSCTLNIDSESTNLTVKAATPLLKVSEMKFRIDEQVSLLEPILADYHSSPRLSPIQLSIDQCTFPLRSWEKLSFNCHFQIPAIHHWMVEKLQGKISVNTLENISAEIAGGELQMKGLFALNKEMKELQLKEPLSLDYVLSPTRFQTFFPPDAKTPLLLSPAALHLSIEPCSLSLTDSILKNLKTSASGSIDSLSLQYEQQMHKLKNIQFRCAHDAPEKSLEIYFKTEGESIELKALAKSFQFDKKYDFSKAHLNLSIKAEEFSLALLDGLTFKSHPLTTLFGPSLNLALQVESSPEEQHLSVAAKGKLFNLETSFALKENLLEIKKPSTIDWVLNEKGYALLDRWLTGEKEAPFELQKPSHFHLSIPQLHYALKDKDFSKIAGVATLTSDHCSFIDKKTSRLVSLDNFKVALEHLDQKSPISLDLQGSVNKDGKLALKADYNSSFAKIEGQIQKLPTVLLDICARPFDKLDAPFTLFFGDTINVAVSTELKNFTGPIHLNIHSPNVRTGLTGAFETGILTLKEPLHAQLLLTHKISSLFLKEINPLSITSIESLHPVTLQIDPEGFSLPLFADWRKLSVPSAHIELGQIFCKNEGNLHRTLKLLKQNLDHHVDLTLWFTPIDLHIQDQLCSLERTEILINNSLEICTFGKIDLEKENVNMILGLTSQCLHKAFGIENLPPDYLLQIPLKGSMDNVKLDTKKATAKITSLLLWQKSGLASNALGKGSAGALIGEMIGKLATLPDKDKSAPAAKQPFPWDKNKVAKIKQPKTKKKSRIKKKDKPLKQLLKILT